MNYLDIANSSLLFTVVAFVIAVVFVQSVIFMVIAWRRGVELGISRKKMLDAIRSSAIFSIVPSLPILLALVAMVPVLGLPFPWLRLGVIGSAPYELLAANIGAQSMGVQGLGYSGFTDQVFINSMWIMSLGILWSPVLFLLLAKRMQKGMNNMKKSDSKWLEIMIASLFFGMLSVFIGQPIVVGGIQLATILTSAAIMFAITAFIRRYSIDWLSNFSLSIAMIASMALAILYSRIM
ncbi:MAG TPA: DUF5058 family protein [Spirochaetota bacterium]|nr:DUF5058 family protein [Spirochaetota bacterium]HPJ34372.1 DUF5058 family protein [Spirochaetota bacterium]